MQERWRGIPVVGGRSAHREIAMKAVASRWRTNSAAPRPERRDLRKDILWGVKWGWRIAIGYSILALIAVMLTGPGHFADRSGLGIVSLLFFYLSSGPLLGGVVGLLRPLAKSTSGTMLIGLVCGVLVGVMAAVGFVGLPWNSTHTMMIRYFGGFGSIGALVFRWRATKR